MIPQQTLSLDTLRRPSPHFQRAINLKYDLGNGDYIAGYIPTPNAMRALVALLAATHLEARQRAHLLHGAYGSGKSLFATVLAAILSRDKTLSVPLSLVLARLRRDFDDIADIVESQLVQGVRLLPVVLSGDEGELSSSLGRALDRTLASIDLGHIRPPTVYRAALETIQQWRVDYPDTYQNLGRWLEEHDKTRDELMRALRLYQPEAYQLFLEAYPHLTAGASFDRYNGQSIIQAYLQTAKELNDTGYDGIVVLWDEFGRFLEARAGEPTGKDAALLQEFAEACNRSTTQQVHLVLITHKEFGQYSSHLPSEYQREWKRIADRFRQVDISGDPETSYRLIAEALNIVDPDAWAMFLDRQQSEHDLLLEQIFDLGLFRLLTEERIRELIIQGAYPLHPLTTYCLPRLSNAVSQNERTLFTFLASEEPDALKPHLVRTVPGAFGTWVRLDKLWDYFSNAVRVDVGVGGAHPVWANVEAALHKIPPEDALAAQLVKSLGVLAVTGNAEELRPTTALLGFAVGEEGHKGHQAVENRLRHLVRRKTIIFSQVEGAWEFFSGSGIDLEAKLAEAQETRLLNPIQRRQLLERVLPPHHYRARRFNQQHGMTRFFWSLYRTPQELLNIDWNLLLRKIRANGQQWEYSDGVIVYVLATDEAELAQARQVAQDIAHRQVVVVVPRQALLLKQPLIDWLVLDELNSDARFKEQDPDRIQRELDFYLSEASMRLVQALAPLTRPMLKTADWYYRGTLHVFSSDAAISRFLSDICADVFSQTPRLFNELLNKRYPSSVQVRASNQAIDALFSEPLAAALGLVGNGPDVMAVRTILRAPNILRELENGEWEIGIPYDLALAQVWHEIECFLQDAQTEPQSFDRLLHRLQSPPFGLRLGLVPLLISAVMRRHLHVITLRKGQRVLSPLTGPTLTNACRHPDQHALEMGVWDTRQEAMRRVLERQFSDQVLLEERRHQSLDHLSLGMLRWLQNQPRYARDTDHISPDAVELRNLIREARVDPASVLFKKLPTTLLSSQDADAPQMMQETDLYENLLENRLQVLLTEISMAPHQLQERLNQFIVEHFSTGIEPSQSNGQSSLQNWLSNLEQQAGTAIETLRFGDARAQGLVHAIQRDESGEQTLLERLSQAVVGVSLLDWNDRSEETFTGQLLETKQQIENEVFGLVAENEAIQLRISAPEKEDRVYRFRPTGLSVQGKRILENFKSTLRIAGRPLSPDERRQIALALMHHVLGEEDA